MATRISVTVKGALGLDEAEAMLADLEEATGLRWHSRQVDEGPVLTGGVVEVLLIAVVGKVTEMSVQTAVKALVRRWRSEHLDPPEIAVDTEQVPDAAPTAPAAPAAPAAPVAPAAPAAPAAADDPVGPAGPDDPVGPVDPVDPDGPAVSGGTGG